MLDLIAPRGATPANKSTESAKERALRNVPP